MQYFHCSCNNLRKQDINEEGMGAAAATGVVMTKSMKRPLMFLVDHHFLFLIRENQKGVILLIVRIVDPTK